jgi:hypothetical protein
VSRAFGPVLLGLRLLGEKSRVGLGQPLLQLWEEKPSNTSQGDV